MVESIHYGDVDESVPRSIQFVFNFWIMELYQYVLFKIKR